MTARCDWHWWSTVLRRLVWFLPWSCWSWWQNCDSCWPGWWLSEVYFKLSLDFNDFVPILMLFSRVAHYLILVVFHESIYYSLPLKFNEVPVDSGIKCSQEEFWFRSWYNPPCWFCNQVERTMWNLWKTCFLHLKKDRGDTDRTDWRDWCLYACMSTPLCQWTSCRGSCKNGPAISEGYNNTLILLRCVSCL